MDKNSVSKTEIDSLESFVFDELKKDYLPDDRNLNMPGLEIILMMLASKVVLPIFVSVGGRFAYDKISKWRKGELKKEDVLEEAENMQTDNTAPVPESQVKSEIVADLQRDGIPAEKATALAEKAFEKFKALRK
jgi:hypothetical protein